MKRMLGGTLCSRRLGTATTVLGVVAAASLVVPVLSTPVLGSTSVAARAAIAGPGEANLTVTALDLGAAPNDMVAGRGDVDGDIVVGAAGDDAFAYDLASPEPHIQRLGGLGGGMSEATAVDGAIVVGWGETTTRGEHAFAYDLAAANPAMIDLGTLGGSSSAAGDVDGTIVVGSSSTASGESHAFVYDLAAPDPVMQDLGTLGGDSSWATAVDGGIVVGRADTPSGESHAFVYDLAAPDPVMQDLGTLGGDSSWATAVDGGIVVGRADTPSGESHAFVYDLAAPDPVMRDLGTLGGDSSWAAAVDGDMVVGTALTAKGKTRAFAYDLAAPDPVMRNLGTLAGAPTSASGIDGDVVIGRWELRTGEWYPYRAFAYDLSATDPHFVDLGAGGRRESGVGGVDDGVVVGWADEGNRDYTATAWLLGETTRPMVAFRRVHHKVKEGVGRVTVRVTRYGRTDRAVTVRFRTRSDTAKAGKDFVARSGTLRFAKGVTRRSFKVKILNDQRRERDEDLVLKLSGPSSPALLGTPKWSQVRIRDNDH